MKILILSVLGSIWVTSPIVLGLIYFGLAGAYCGVFLSCIIATFLVLAFA